MSEQTGAPAEGAQQQTQTTAQQTTTTETTPPAGVSPEAWGALGDPGKAAITAEREARAAAEKSAATLQAQLDEIAKANLSELERAQASAKESQEAAAKATAEALRYRLAAAHGISAEPGPNGEPSDAETFLTAPDEAGMTKQAERLAARLTAQGDAPTFPRADLTQGSGRDTANAPSAGADFQKFLSSQLG